MFNSLDYRRFDHLGSDSDEDSAEDYSQPNKTERAAADIMNGILRREQQGCGRIKIHPRDSTAPEWVYSDPDTWVAPACPREIKLLHACMSCLLPH